MHAPNIAENNRLIDYFFVGGLNTAGLTVDLETHQQVSFEKGLFGEVEFKARLLDRYPLVDHREFPLNPDICLFLFPEGLIFSNEPKPPTFFHFVMTEGDGRHAYGSVLRFYESMDLDEAFGNVTVHVLPRVASLPSQGTLVIDGTPIFTDGNEVGDSGAVEVVKMVHTMFTKTSGVRRSPRARTTQTIEVRRYITELEEKKGPATDFGKLRVYAPKCLSVISHHPLFSSHREFLSYVYRLAVDRQETLAAGVPLEAIIRHFTLEVPLPPPGMTRVAYSLGALRCITERPPPNQPPLLEVSLHTLFEYLDAKTVVTILKFLMLEYKIVVHSKHIGLLSAVCEALRSFLFPLQWHFVYVPVLPRGLLDYLSAPYPFLVGVVTSCLPPLATLGDVIVLAIDECRIYAPSGKEPPSLPKAEAKLLRRLKPLTAHLLTKSTTKKQAPPPDLAFPHTSTSLHFSVPSLILSPSGGTSPRKLGGGSVASTPSSAASTPSARSGGSEISSSRSMMSFNSFSANEGPVPNGGGAGGGSRPRKFSLTNNTSVSSTATSAPPSPDSLHGGEKDRDSSGGETVGYNKDKVRNAFLRFWVSVLLRYRDFILRPAEDVKPSATKCFNFTGFVKDQPDTNREFMSLLVKTQGFHEFIEMRVDPLKAQRHAYQIQFFDETIAKKRNLSAFHHKKQQTPFLDSPIYVHAHTHECEPPPVQSGHPTVPPISAPTTSESTPQMIGYFPKLRSDMFGAPKEVVPLELENFYSRLERVPSLADAAINAAATIARVASTIPTQPEHEHEPPSASVAAAQQIDIQGTPAVEDNPAQLTVVLAPTDLHSTEEQERERALLAQLEEEERQREAQRQLELELRAVLTLQKHMRGFFARMQFRRLKACVIAMQARCRAVLARAEFLRAKHSSIRIQTAWRRYETRSKYLHLRECTIKGQAVIRRWSAVRVYRRARALVIRLQACTRRWVCMYKLGQAVESRVGSGRVALLQLWKQLHINWLERAQTIRILVQTQKDVDARANVGQVKRSVRLLRGMVSEWLTFSSLFSSELSRLLSLVDEVRAYQHSGAAVAKAQFKEGVLAAESVPSSSPLTTSHSSSPASKPKPSVKMWFESSPQQLPLSLAKSLTDPIEACMFVNELARGLGPVQWSSFPSIKSAAAHEEEITKSLYKRLKAHGSGTKTGKNVLAGVFDSWGVPKKGKRRKGKLFEKIWATGSPIDSAALVLWIFALPISLQYSPSQLPPL